MPHIPSRETDPEQFPDKPLEYEGTGEVERAILSNYSLTWCDGCRKRRPCIPRKSGVIYEGKDCEIRLCRYCRAHETRRNKRTIPHLP